MTDAPKSPRKAKRILLIHGDDTERTRLAEHLESRGFEVLQSGRARTGLLQAANQNVDVIVLDLDAPDAEGFETLGKFRKGAQTKLLPILLLSQMHHRADLQQAAALGAAGFIKKPVDLGNLLRKIRRILAPITRRTGLTMP